MIQNLFCILTLIVFLIPNSNFAQSAPQQAAVGRIVISQLYGGGGNSGAAWRNDFIELFNRGNQAVVIDGWSIQYASATGTTWQKVDLSGRIEPGGRFLVQLTGGSNGAALPSADAIGVINLSATAGKVALVNDGGLLGAACPPGAQVVDFAGYGNSANCFEGSGPAPAPSSTRAIIRAGDGCTDSNDNATDFSTAAPAPRNSGASRNSCGGEAEPENGHPLPVESALSGLKAGSILIYPIYSSKFGGHLSQNTRLSLTNTDPLQSVTVHLFFVDGNSEAVMDGFLCLTAGQTATFLASDLDPGVTGYMIAMAVDPLSGCPVKANALIGDAFVKLDTGLMTALPAQAVAAVTDPSSACTSTASSIEIAFDGVSYNRLPAELAVNNFRTGPDGEGPSIILLRPDKALGRVSGLLFDDAENAWNFEVIADRSHLIARFSNSFPDLSVKLSSIVPAGRSGWMRLKCIDGGALTGVMLNSPPGISGEGRNLHVLSLSPDTRWTVPVLPPVC